MMLWDEMDDLLPFAGRVLGTVAGIALIVTAAFAYRF